MQRIKKMIKLPYGISDFKSLTGDNFYYIDKTHFIEKLEEQPRYLFFIRPRRFGKSLFLSMLSYYYDIKYKDSYSEIFKNTYILNNPTKEANSYHVLRFDFSVVDTQRPRESMNEYCNLVLQSFVNSYKLQLEFSSDSFISNLNVLLTHLQDNNLHIYLILDEYDNFINRILVSDVSEYKKYITDKEALFKQFFTVLKAGTGMQNSPLKKMFITGVSPMALYDVTSGYNIGSNISTNPIFNSMVGVTKDELSTMIAFYNLEDVVDVELMEHWYNHYCFNTKSQETIYNTDMVLYYLNHFLTNGTPPEELIDINVRSDYSKLRYLIYTDKKLNGNFSTLQGLIYDAKVPTTKIVDNFSALELTKAENFKSLLYYLGLSTIESDGFDLFLKVPNETIKRIAIGYIKDSLELEKVFSLNLDTFNLKLKEFARSGDIEVFRYLGELIKESSSLRDYINGEFFIKSFYLAYLSLSDYFTTHSEVELNKGFADILLKPLHPLVSYFGLLEFKYIKRNEFSQTLLTKKVAEAKEQLSRYSDDKSVSRLLESGKSLQAVVIVFNGWECVWCEEMDLNQRGER
jgi:hypothetical protein